MTGDRYVGVKAHASDEDELPYVFQTLEHEIRHVILDEQEHVSELGLLQRD